MNAPFSPATSYAAPLFAFARERHSIYLRRQAAVPPPWTADPILSKYKFTNIYRRLDRVSVWIHENWLEPHRDDPDLWFAMIVARFVNVPEVLAEIGWPVPWKPEHFIAVMASRKARGLQMYTGAYMVRNDHSSTPKAEYQAKCLYGPLWKDRDWMRSSPRESCRSYHARLSERHGLGGDGFMAQQIVADLIYAPPLIDAEDRETFCARGPGSMRGLNRLLGHDTDVKWSVEAFRREVARLREELTPMFEAAGWPVPIAMDITHTLCEFDKYERVRLGEGKPRSRYRAA